MKSILSRHTGMRMLTMMLISLLMLVGVLVNMPEASAATKTTSSPYYLETYTAKEGTDTVQYKVHQYPWLTQTDNVSGAYHYPSQSVNMGWVDVYEDGMYMSNVAGTVDQWDKEQGSTILSRNSDINLTDSTATTNYFQLNSLQTSDNNWWPNEGAVWNYVANPDSNCTLTGNPLESPWGDLQATLNCLNFASPGTTSFLSGYDHHTGQYIFTPWSTPQARAFGHGFWEENTGIASIYSSLHTSDQGAVAATSATTARAVAPSHFSALTFSNPVFLASYNTTRQGITAEMQLVSRPNVRPALATLTVALGLIAVGLVMAAVGTYLNQPCPANTNPQCWGQHTLVWQRVGMAMQILGGGWSLQESFILVLEPQFGMLSGRSGGHQLPHKELN